MLLQTDCVDDNYDDDNDKGYVIINFYFCNNIDIEVNFTFSASPDYSTMGVVMVDTTL